MFNMYCDESCHLEHDNSKVMVIGGVSVDNQYRKQAYKEIKEIKMRYNIPLRREIKWTKVSKNKIEYYKALVEYFINNQQLKFRGVVVPNKFKLNHRLFHQTQDEFYYKMYYDMLKKNLINHRDMQVFIDIKDTNSSNKVLKLQSYLERTSSLNVNNLKIMQIRSHENSLLQMSDLLIGCITYKNRGLTTSNAKLELIDFLEENINISLTSTSPYCEEKFNLLVMDRI